MTSISQMGYEAVDNAPPLATGRSGKTGYNETVIKYFTIASIFWGVAGMTVGLLLAAQLAWPMLNFEPWLNFGRLRPLHTSAVIFAFGGNILFATSYHVVQRTGRTRLFSDKLAWVHFWGYQAFILRAGLGYLAGVTQGLEYAEPEWYADLWLTVVWVVYLINFLGTLMLRKEKHIYVANWFFLAFILTVAILHLVNGAAIPWSPTSVHSTHVWGGVQSALIQWWYGHNAVGFFLTAGFLGMMYYYVPKQAGRPVYSYRLSILHFWSLIFIYIWAGPHHLLYTSLPDWAQTLGMTFSIMLWMPSWGGMINGMMTLSGAWHKLRDDPVLQFMIVALSFYGMSTFEGPLMSIKFVNSLSHYTEWTIGHVHSGALGWVAYISFGAIYYLVPHLWKKPLFSKGLVSLHLWVSSIGIVGYIATMWLAGIGEGLNLSAYNDKGFLTYSFVEVVQQKHIFYILRAASGGLYLLGVLIMVYNIYRTINAKLPSPEQSGQSAAVVAE